MTTKPVVIKFLSAVLLLLGPAFSHTEILRVSSGENTEKETPALQHENAVKLARQGKYNQALTILEKLMGKEPADKSLLYDYIVVLSWGKKDGQALDSFKKIEKEKVVPLYVLSAAAQSARRNKNRNLALTLYKRMLNQQPDHLPAQIGIGLIYSDKGAPGKAIIHLKALEQKNPHNIELLFALAYVHQLKTDVFTEMTYYQKILDIEPHNPHAKRAYILSASTLGAPNLALEMMETDKDLDFSSAAVVKIKGDRAAQQVLWGELIPETRETRFDETDKALRLLEENIKRIEADETLTRRSLYRAFFDRLIALRDRIWMKETVKHYEAHRDAGLDIPDYAKIQAADAYLYLARPKKAKTIYDDIFKRDPGFFNAGLSLFYGYLESEKYGDAGSHLRALARKQPTWFRLKNSRVYGENPKKLSADKTAIMFDAYSRRLKKAQLKMETKLDMAPYNRNIRTDLATLYMWRGWRRKAIRQFHLVLAQEPDHLGARIGQTHLLIDSNKYGDASETVQLLWNRFPEKKAVQKLKRDWDTHHMWYFHSEMIGGRGKSLVLGSRDFSMDNFLYTPPFGDWFKGFLHYHTHSAKFFGEEALHRRWGVGMDFNRGDLGGRVEVLRRFTGDPDYGYRLGGRWNMDDFWELSADYTYNGLDIPLKGRIVDLKGNSAAVNLVWRLSDLTHFKSAFSIFDFNDGNRRYALFLSGYRRLYTGPKFLLAASGEFYTSSNSLRDRYYFNPESDVSYMVSLDGWQTLYRFYDFKFVHRLVVGYGNYRQKNYDPGWMGVIRYEHHWDFNDRQAILYGVGFSRRLYDGNPESAVTFYVTVNWRF